MTMPDDTPTVVVPCVPTRKMLIEGVRALDLWSDEHHRETVDSYEMAAKVWKAMTSNG